MTGGALPTGLTLNATTGALTGTPAATGNFSFTISATINSGNGGGGSHSYTVAIGCQMVSFSPTTLPGGNAGVAYSQSLSMTPAGAYSFSLLTGSLPAGLNLNTATGVISGTPTVTGASSFTLKAQQANDCGGTQSYWLTIHCPTMALAPASLPNGTTGAAYAQTLSVTPAGGNATFAVTSGALPSGVALNPSTGSLAGTPTTNGTYNFTSTATGFGGCTGSKSYTVMIGGTGCPAIALPPSPPNGGVGQLYTTSAAASPASSYNYAVTEGSLPPGVILIEAIGLVYGYPTAPGSYTFTIQASDANNCTGSQSYSLTIGGGLAARADFDGDRKTDFAVWRGRAGDWLIVQGDGQTKSMQWGSAADPDNDVMVAGDYDGDGITDLAVFRRGGRLEQAKRDGTWLIKGSRDGSMVNKVWGQSADTPVVANYDGDGKADLAVWRGAYAHWYILRSSDNALESVLWGAADQGDLPVPGDYDGDGKTDVAVWRPAEGRWYIRRSSDGMLLTQINGAAGDTPVAMP